MEMKDWPFAGKVVGAIVMLLGFASPLVIATWAFASASSDLRYQQKRSEEQYGVMLGKFDSLSTAQQDQGRSLQSLRDLFVETRAENKQTHAESALRMSELERRVTNLEEAPPR